MTDPYAFDIADVAEIDVPKSAAGRPTRPNPLTEIVKRYSETRAKAGTFTIPYGTKEAMLARKKDVLNDLSRAGKELNVTVRRTVVEKPVKPGATAGDLVVTFWVIDRIVKTPAADTADNTADNTAAADTADNTADNTAAAAIAGGSQN